MNPLYQLDSNLDYEFIPIYESKSKTIFKPEFYGLKPPNKRRVGYPFASHKCSLLVSLISSALAQIGVLLGRLGHAVGETNEYDQMVHST